MDHHYVPQFYTRRWADNGGRLLRYNRADGSSIAGVEELLRNVTFGHDLILLNEQRCPFIYTSRKLEDLVSDGRIVRMGVAAEAALKRWET
ncbi:MAG: hypothetical protein U0169_27770 [Polyangiaceae bacterium]